MDEKSTNLFKKFYGSSPTVVAYVWCDIVTNDDNSLFQLSDEEKTENGFKRFLITMHFLWAYPKNATLLSTAFNVSLRQVEGENLWRWVKIIAALTAKKIIWPEEEYQDPNTQIFIISVDGVDFRCWEAKHPTMPYDKGMYSHKYKKAALKYEIAIDIFRSKIVWISGPHQGGKHDKVIYLEDLCGKIPPSKKIIVDRVYG